MLVGRMGSAPVAEESVVYVDLLELELEVESEEKLDELLPWHIENEPQVKPSVQHPPPRLTAQA